MTTDSFTRSVFVFSQQGFIYMVLCLFFASILDWMMPKYDRDRNNYVIFLEITIQIFLNLLLINEFIIPMVLKTPMLYDYLLGLPLKKQPIIANLDVILSIFFVSIQDHLFKKTVHLSDHLKTKYDMALSF
jgi:hypothetical protein